MSDGLESVIYEFGEFRIETAGRRLLRRIDGGPVALQPKAFDLLLLLLESDGRLLTKAEILDAVWAESFVEEANLSQTIFVLRKALGDDRRNPRYVVTVPNRGYKFIEKAERIDATAAATVAIVAIESAAADQISATRHRKFGLTSMLVAAAFLSIAIVVAFLLFNSGKQPAAVTEIKSIAVLPFRNIGAEADEEYLGAGLPEVLITRLSSIRTITVRQTGSAYGKSDEAPDPQKIGRELGVEAIISGSVQKSGENIRVTVQLVRVADGATLWAETFDDKLTNLYAVQDSISDKVTQSLAVRLSSGEREQIAKRFTTDDEAFRLYLQGRFFWNKRTTEDLKKAAEFFSQAIAKDPNFARAYAGLADSYLLLGSSEYVGMNPADAIARAKVAANKAIELDETLGEAHASLGFLLYVYDFDWPRAEREFKRAVDLSPNYTTARHWYGLYLIVMRRFDESEIQLRAALDLDPTSLIVNTDYGTVFYFSRRFDEAVAQYKKTLELEQRYAVTHWQLARAYSQQKRYDEATAEIERAISIAGRSPVFLSLLGYLKGVSGKKNEASAILKELEDLAGRQTVSPHNLMIVEIGLGNREKALAMLEKSFAQRSPSLVVLGNEPIYDPLRNEPRFDEILRELKLKF